MSNAVTVEFPSDYKYLNLVDLVCGEVIDDMGFEKVARNEIAISVVEACTNALEHGNKCCASCSVHVTFIEADDRLIVEIIDCGDGFDWKSYIKHIPDPSDIHHLRGRGIYIMGSMMDAVDFEMIPDRGMKVILEKMIRKGDGADSP
jgi:serine/threonine-protein kinase RsbW